MSKRSLIQELKRRNVIKAAVSYAAVSWLLLQAASIIFPALEMTNAAMQYLLIFLIIGFPAWLVFAWVYEYTPAGFKKTNEIDQEESISSATSKRLNTIIIGVLTMAVLLLLADRIFLITTDPIMEYTKNSIAVLPFENMGAEEDDYFATGIVEDIQTQISKLGDLKVLSRFTIREYDTEGKTPSQIGEELRVAHLLAGSIRRVGTELRIDCQLINTEDQTESWAETFDHQFENIFSIQSEVALKVAGQLKSQLTEEEKSLIEKPPTKNLVAYNNYLRGKDIFYGYNGVANDKAIEYFKTALDLDPQFAEAWASLSGSYSLAVYSFGNRPYEYLDTAMLMARRAVDLDPACSKCWNSLGLAHDVKGQHEEAIKIYNKAIEINPNNTTAITNLAIILNGYGRLDESISLQEKSLELDPLDPRAYNSLAGNYRRLEMYDEALEKLEFALALEPDDWITLYYIAYTHILKGTPEQATPFIENMVKLDPGNARLLEIAGELCHYFDPQQSRIYFEKALQSDDFSKANNFFTPVGIGYHLWVEGKKDSANVWFEESLLQQKSFLEQGSEDTNPIMMMASIHAIRGENRQALQLLKDVAPASLDFKSWELSPMSSGLLDDPEYIELLENAKMQISRIRKKLISERLKG